MKLTEPAPDDGLEITITSDDPKRLLLAKTPHEPGSKSIKIKVGGHYFETPDFYVQALDEKGEATYTAAAPGYASGKGKVKLGRSAILLIAPLRAPRIWTTPSTTQRVGLESVLLDAEGKVVEKQAVASNVRIELMSSNPKVGGFPESAVTIQSGEAVVGTDFKPVGAGNATLSLKPPAGFAVPAESATVDARVELPGIGVAGEVSVGKDLQIPGFVLLGEAAPAGGLDVTLTSSDPSKLVLSDSETKLGTGTLKIHIEPSMMRASYFIQALGSEGTVNYIASAPGYRNRTAPVYLAPTGIMIAYSAHGAPDEAEYLRPKTRIPRPFIASLSAKKPEHVAIWTVYLDPVTRRGADMTAQKLRPGVSVQVELSSSNPKVGKLPGVLKLDGSSEFYMAEFTALSPGETVLSVNTPPGFLTPSNATSVTATVKE